MDSIPDPCCHAHGPSSGRRRDPGDASWDAVAEGRDVAALRAQLLELTGDVAMVVALQRYPSVFKALVKLPQLPDALRYFADEEQHQMLARRVFPAGA